MPLCICVQPHVRTHQSKPPKEFIKSHCWCKHTDVWILPTKTWQKQRNSKKVQFHTWHMTVWMDNFLRRETILEWIKVAIEDTIINNYKNTHCWATERRAPELQPSFSRVHSFSTWAQPSSLVRLSKPVGLCVRVRSVVSDNEWVCEGWGSWEFPVRSKWAGQTSRVKPGLCSVALYMAPLLWPLSRSLSTLSTPLF